MSDNHGEIEMQKPVSEFAAYLKNLIPPGIPETYTLKPTIKSIASDKNIREGIAAFRDFLYLLCERLISHGHLYVKPKKTNSPTDYEFVNNTNNILVDIGYRGKLSESVDTLLLAEVPLFASLKSRISAPKQLEVLKFLSLCGFVFNSIDLDDKKLNVSELQALEVSYPSEPIMLTGLKALSVADMELRTSRRYWNDYHLLRCNYRLIQAKPPDMLDVLKDFLHPLPKELQEFAISLHKRYTAPGLTCVSLNDRDIHFAYAYTEKSKKVMTARDIYQQRIWGFNLSVKNGYCLLVRAKKTDRYADITETFPSYLKEKIKQGYGCDRKLRNERCQGGCQGIRIPLDDRILDIKREIEIWLDNEMPDSLK